MQKYNEFIFAADERRQTLIFICFIRAYPRKSAVKYSHLFHATRYYTSAHIFLDNNPTHINKMKTDFLNKSDVPMTIRFHHLPSYLPLCKPTEYLIHLIREKYLHHHDYKLKLPELKKILGDNLLGLYLYFQRTTGQYFRTHQ